MKRKLPMMIGMMLFMSIALTGFAQSPSLKVLQTWHYAFDPSGTTLPNGFKEKVHVWVNDITKKSYNYTTVDGWKEVNSGLFVPGPAGQSATVTIGTTTTLPAGSQATVTNTGTPSNAVFNFGIPQGAPGASGGGGNTGTVKWVFNETDLVNAWNGIATGATTVIQFGATIYTSKQLTCPYNFTNQPGRRIFIYGNGHMLKDQTVGPTAYLIGLRFANQTEANTYANDPLSYHFNGLKLSGKGTATAALIDLAGCHWSTFENMWLNNANYGIVIRWCMFSRIVNNYSDDIYTTSWFVTRGDWLNSSNNNSSSNMCTVEGNRCFVKEGAFAAVQGYAVSGLRIIQLTFEGQQNCQYGIHFNNQAANEVKDVTIQVIHGECRPTVAAIYIRGSQGSMASIDDVNFQINPVLPGTVLIEAANGGGANTLIISRITFMRGQDVFKSEAGWFWEFDNCYDGANLFTQARWSGTIPKGQSSYNNGSEKVTVKKTN